MRAKSISFCQICIFLKKETNFYELLLYNKFFVGENFYPLLSAFIIKR